LAQVTHNFYSLADLLRFVKGSAGFAITCFTCLRHSTYALSMVSPKTSFNRREFLRLGSGLAVSIIAGGCATGRSGSVRTAAQGSAYPLPLIEVSGSPYECGRAIGRRFGAQIKTGIARRKAWFIELRTFMQADLPGRCNCFLDAARKHLPDALAELHGWADGSGVDFLDLAALNLKAELGCMLLRAAEKSGESESCAACSTLALVDGQRRLLAHNEDGDSEYADLMFFVKESQPGKPAFLGLSYPGILPGNGPAINQAGIVLTTNFIASKNWRAGVPRYFIDRAVLDTRSLAEARRVACNPERAFGFHFNLASVKEKKIVSIETSLDRQEPYEVRGLYVHTNHLLLPGMRDVPQDIDTVGGSSFSRYKVLTAIKAEYDKRLSEIGGADLVKALSSHDGAPYSPCRHPQGQLHGQTLACSLFDLNDGSWTFYPGNPCRARSHKLKPFDFT